jgi:hypothetical protein
VNDYGINEGAQDEDTEVDLLADAFQDVPDAQLRELSPSPVLPAPIAFAHELTLMQQFEYVKPVLIALLNGRHTPSRERHVGFMKGGRTRARVESTAWRRGEVSHRDRDELSRCIYQWMRRRSRRQELGLVPADERAVVRDATFFETVSRVIPHLSSSN